MRKIIAAAVLVTAFLTSVGQAHLRQHTVQPVDTCVSLMLSRAHPTVEFHHDTVFIRDLNAVKVVMVGGRAYNISVSLGEAPPTPKDPFWRQGGLAVPFLNNPGTFQGIHIFDSGITIEKFFADSSLILDTLPGFDTLRHFNILKAQPPKGAVFADNNMSYVMIGDTAGTGLSYLTGPGTGGTYIRGLGKAFRPVVSKTTDSKKKPSHKKRKRLFRKPRFFDFSEAEETEPTKSQLADMYKK